MLAREKINLLLNGKASMKEIKELEAQELEEAKQQEENAPDEKSSDGGDEVDYKALYEQLIASQKEDEDKKKEEPDYKTLYEQEKAKISKIQSDNQKQVIGEDKGKEETNFDHLAKLLGERN